MSRTVKSLLAVALSSLFAVSALAQTADPPEPATKAGAAVRKTKKPPAKDVSAQVDALQGKLDQAQTQIQQQQAEIERLQNSLQDSVSALQQQQRELQASVQKASEQAVAARETATQADSEFADAKTSFVSVNNALQAQDQKVESQESPTTIHIKGITLNPGGFLEGTELWRQRNENADIASSFTGIPLNGTSNSKLSEYRGSARDSRISLLFGANADTTKITGYYEMDFLGAAPTANYVQSSSFTPRLRQAFVQVDFDSGWTVAAGQFWSLLTTDRKGLSTRSEYIPNTMDGAYVVGYTWTRERNLRLVRNFHNGIWVGFEIDDPENTVSAAFTPANTMGLNTSQNTSTGVLLLPFLENYSNGNSTTLAPDMLAKVVFEPGWGHFEIKALGRFFRDRIASTATTTGFNNVTQGYGVGFGAILPVVKNKLDIVAEGLVGQGIGRYGDSTMPDVTLNPENGSMRPLRAAHLMGGIEYHANPRLEFFGYAGTEYTARYAYVSPTGGPAGYGSQLVSYAACTNEVAINTCSGANRDIYEGTVGYWFRPFQGTFGRVQYGNQVEYIHRTLWDGVGQTPQGGDVVVFSTMRWYLP